VVSRRKSMLVKGLALAVAATSLTGVAWRVLPALRGASAPALPAGGLNAAVMPARPDSQVPGLAMSMTVNPDAVAPDGSATFTVTVTNSGRHPATDLVVTVPATAGARPVPGSGLQKTGEGWRWTRARLAAGEHLELTGSMTVTKGASTGALAVRGEASAHGLAQPVEAIGRVAVVNPTGTAERGFVPGKDVELGGAGDAVKVAFPGNAYAEPLQLSKRSATGSEAAKLPKLGSGALGAFMLDAVDGQGKAVHQLKAPVTVTAHYTAESLAAMGVAPTELTLFWYDTAAGRWTPVPTDYDPATNSVVAKVNHFSGFQFADGSSPSEGYLPSMSAAQTSLYTGTSSYSYPIKVPAGAGGTGPKLSLDYSSGSTDGPSGMRTTTQASWVGKGWELAMPSIDLHKVAYTSYGKSYSYYTMSLAGRSYDLMRAEALVSNADTDNPTQWAWRSVDESYLKARIVADAPLAGRGGSVDGVAAPRYHWEVWTKDGTRFEFRDDLWWGWYECDDARQTEVFEQYRWQVSRIVDTHGNTTNYKYDRQSMTGSRTCSINHPGTMAGTVDVDAWPTEVSWGGNLRAGTADPFMVRFQASERPLDRSYDTDAELQFGGGDGVPRKTKQLDEIRVWSNPGTWQLVRRYALAYEDAAHSMTSDARVHQPDGTFAPDPAKKLTLKSITESGSDGSTALPRVDFGYGSNGGTGYYPVNGWNRLTTINNHRGGTATISYAPIGEVNGVPFHNRQRVTARSEADGRGGGSTESYAYGTPNINSLGALGADEGWQGTSKWATSAAMYFAKYGSTGSADYSRLSHTPGREFRGYDYVKVTDATGAFTEHWFRQGDAGCNPTATKSLTAIDADPCFRAIRDNEMLQGREYLMKVTNAPAQGGKLVAQTSNGYGVRMLDYTSEPRSGLWRAFTFQTSKDEAIAEGADALSVKRTQYFYSSDCANNNDPYGNLGCVTESTGDGTTFHRVRSTKTWYTTTDTESWSADRSTVKANYVVNRAYQTAAYDQAGNMTTLTQKYYDNLTNPALAPTLGELRRTSTFFDIPGDRPNLTGLTVHSKDVVQEYDPKFGNVVKQSTYSGPGSLTVTASAVTYSAPGGGGAARTTTTAYETVFNALPTSMTDPLGAKQSAGYDLRMGTMTSITGQNGEVTTVTYDVFGRLATRMSPGDSAAAPTVQMSYDDALDHLPAYRVRTRGLSSDGYHESLKFYDGLGRLIQTKEESRDQAQNIVVDTRYDSLGREAGRSQARYVDQTGAAFLTFTDPGSTLFRPTSKTYDALGRILTVTMPDGSTLKDQYGVAGEQTWHVSIDATRHLTQYLTDALGRLNTVNQFSGNCASDGSWGMSCGGANTRAYDVDAVTGYGYDTLDRLTAVVDAQGNRTTMSYDALGRKTRMVDPDTGTTSYTYDANGDPVTQTDARGVALWFGYDKLDRLTAKRVGSASGTVLATYAYGESGVSNGVGRRTSMTSYLNGQPDTRTRWTYDQRGRVVVQAQQTSGAPELSLTNTYNASDQVTSSRYQPLDETVTYTYDAAGRPTAMTSDVTSSSDPTNGVYVAAASYTALDQPLQRTNGNGTVQNWTYNNVMARLSNLQVGTTAAPAGYLNESYAYDAAGNLNTWNSTGIARAYSYDDHSRVNCLKTNGAATCTEFYTYDNLGRLLTNGAKQNTYPAAGSSQPHAVTESQVPGSGSAPTDYTYDADGNMVISGQTTSTTVNGYRYVWDQLNQLTTVLSRSNATEVDNAVPAGPLPPGVVVEGYTYDADGIRTSSTAGDRKTVYAAGWEYTIGGTQRKIYTFNGQVVAQRDNNTTVTFLHADHLGSIRATTNASGAVTSSSTYSTWGSGGSTSATTMSYTAQRKTGTGLLYYQSRYYDPNLSQFISADPVVPGTPTGEMGNTALTSLTTNVAETGLLTGFNTESRGEASDKLDRMGPANPLSLNRYAYAQSNPLKYTDPSGHSIYLDDSHPNGPATPSEAEQYLADIRDAQGQLEMIANNLAAFTIVLSAVGSVTAAFNAVFKLGMNPIAFLIAGAVVSLGLLALGGLKASIDQLKKFGDSLKKAIDANDDGVIISVEADDSTYPTERVTVVNRGTGNGGWTDFSIATASAVFPAGSAPVVHRGHFVMGTYVETTESTWGAGYACTRSGADPSPGNYYNGDHHLCHER
jgi:RHS repeat-associated protein/uncharacterized repeat protein (TIGR01451 family)